MPFAVPLHDVPCAVLGQAGGDDLQWFGEGCRDLLELFLHLEDGVDRGIESPGDLTVDVGHRLQVLVVAVAFALAVDHGRHLGQRDHAAVASVDRQLQEVIDVSPLGAFEAEYDGYRVATGGHVGETGVGAVESDPQGAHDLFRGDAGSHSLLTVYVHLDPWAGRLDLPVDINDTVGGGEDLLHLARDLETALEGGSVDLRDQGREHGRSGRDFRHLDVHTGGQRDRLQHLAHPVGKGVRLVRAFVLVDEVDLDVGLVGVRTEEVMANQPVEIEGGGGADVDLEVGHLGHGAESARYFSGHRVCLLEREPLGGVDHNLQLRLVVVGEHFDGGEAHGNGSHRGDQQGRNPGEE